MNNKIIETLKGYKKQLETKGYNVLYMGLYGSQNYNLDDKNSDIDVKVIIAPKFEDFVKRQPISKTEKLSKGEAQICDILTFYEIIKKGNPAGLEAIYSDYWLGDKNIKDFFMKFKVNQRAIIGMTEQKYIALDHKYPSKIKEIEKWGFDPKQLHHIIRLYDLLNAIVNENYDKPFITYNNKNKQQLLNIKRNSINLNLPEARQLANEYFNKIKALVKKEYKFNKFTTKQQDDFIMNIIKETLKKELIKPINEKRENKYHEK